MSNHPSSSSSRKCSTAATMAASKLNEQTSAGNVKKEKQKQKQKQNPRSPLQALNKAIPISISRSSSNCSSISSSISIDAPRGCLRFFSKTPLHHNRSKPKFLSKATATVSAPKSAPSPSNPIHSKEKENQWRRKSKKKSPCLYQWQSGKRTSSTKAAPRLKTSPWLSESELQEQQKKCRSGELFIFPGFANNSTSIDHVVAEDCTPAGKLASGSVSKPSIGTDSDCKSRGERSSTRGNDSGSGKTPPVQSSLSPEIPCGSSVLVSGATPNSATPCYGAGHVVSGVIDRRKCRPQGTLIVGASSHLSGCVNPDFECSGGLDDGNGARGVRKSRHSFIPLPIEASLSWNLSPCQEDEGGSVIGEHSYGLHQYQHLMGSATRKFDSNMFVYGKCRDTSRSDSESGMKTRITLLSPKALPEFQGCSRPSSEKVTRHSSSVSPYATPVLSQQKRISSEYNFIAGNSPFLQDSLDSENVIQTPKSDSSNERLVTRSWLKKEDDQKHCFEYELDSVAELLRQASLSPKSDTSLWDPLGLSCKLADLPPPSNSIDCSHLQYNGDSRASCFSNSTSENVSESQMRISWRDGLVSRIFEMGDLDFCRLSSDEENEAELYSNDLLKSHQANNLHVELQNDGSFSNDGLSSPEFLENEVKIDGKKKSPLSPMQANSCAESMCTDGGGLVASRDSDWTLCYKNQLFQV